MIFFHWRALQCLHFPIAKNMKTLQWSDITVIWPDEDVTLSSFSFYYTWHNDLRLYNRIVLAIIIIIIIIIRFIHSGIVVIWDPLMLIFHLSVSLVSSTLGKCLWHCRSNDIVGWEIKIHNNVYNKSTTNDNNALKWILLLWTLWKAYSMVK